MQCQPTTRYFQNGTVPFVREVWKDRESREMRAWLLRRGRFLSNGDGIEDRRRGRNEGQVCHRATDSKAKVGQASATPRRGFA
jgi:hypothetical protein